MFETAVQEKRTTLLLGRHNAHHRDNLGEHPKLRQMDRAKRKAGG